MKNKNIYNGDNVNEKQEKWNTGAEIYRIHRILYHLQLNVTV